MSMTRKDFECLAQTLAYCEAHCDSDDELRLIGWVTGHIAEALEREYPRFDEARFRAAANPIGVCETRVRAAR